MVMLPLEVHLWFRYLVPIQKILPSSYPCLDPCTIILCPCQVWKDLWKGHQLFQPRRMCDCYFQTCLQAPLTLDYHLQQQQPILHASHLGLVPKQFLCLHCGHVGLEPPFRQPLPVSPGFWSSPASSDPVFSIHLLIRNPASWDSPQILSGRLLCNTVTFLYFVVCPAYLHVLGAPLFVCLKC